MHLFAFSLLLITQCLLAASMPRQRALGVYIWGTKRVLQETLQAPKSIPDVYICISCCIFLV